MIYGSGYFPAPSQKERRVGKKSTLDDCKEAAKKLNGRCLEATYKNTTTKMLWVCERGHEFKTIFKTVKIGHWCPECAGNKKIPHDTVRDTIKKLGGELLSEYRNCDSPLDIRCNIDNHVWHPNWTSIKNGHWCPKCAGFLVITPEFITSFIESRDGYVVDISNHRNAKSKITMQCSKDGHQWTTDWSCLKQGTWCPKCAKKVIRTRDEYIAIINDKGGTVLDFPHNHNSQTKIKIRCDKDGYIWTTSCARLTINKSWCPKCAKKVRIPFSEVRDFVSRKGGMVLSADDCLKTNSDKLDVRCENGHEWSISYGNLIYNNRWCPKCVKLISQKKLQGIIEDILGTKAISNYKGFDWLRDKRNLEIDIWFPDIKLAIEYDGIHHFRPVNYGNDIDRANRKFAERQRKDALKDRLIAEHPNEVRYFLRIPHTAELSPKSILTLLSTQEMP